MGSTNGNNEKSRETEEIRSKDSSVVVVGVVRHGNN